MPLYTQNETALMVDEIYCELYIKGKPDNCEQCFFRIGAWNPAYTTAPSMNKIRCGVRNNEELDKSLLDNPPCTKMDFIKKWLEII